jgi:hypothetical protein
MKGLNALGPRYLKPTKEGRALKARGPESFYSMRFKDDYGFYPVGDLFAYKDWSTTDCLEFVMGGRPISIAVLTGYGIYLQHEDFWVFGRTVGEVIAVAEEWPEEQAP